MTQLTAVWLDRVAYAPAFALQQALAERRGSGAVGDLLLQLEHEHVFTLGRRATEDEVLMDEATREALHVSVEHADRGGRVTYHGPGQLTGYPIIDLGPTTDLVGYVRTLERAMIATCARFDVTATVIDGLTGVWVGDAKIGAIGVHISRGITTHGYALNVDPDLSMFNGIVPCGIVDKGVTSLTALTGAHLTARAVSVVMAEELARALDRELVPGSPGDLGVAVHV